MSKTILFLLPVFFASSALADAFTLTSSDISGATLGAAQYANVFGCEGGNISPGLVWSDPPEGTKSFVVTAYDPDAPTGSGFWHWTVANIPGDVRALATGVGNGEAALPEGAMMTSTDTGQPGYLGACPPVGESHHYIFTVKALSVEALNITPGVTPAMLGFMSNAVKLGEARIEAIGAR